MGSDLRALCAGRGGLLAAELSAITGLRPRPRAAAPGSTATCARRCSINLECRLGQRVLWPLIDGPYRDEHDLYDLARRVDWVDWITPEQTLRVDVNAQRSPAEEPELRRAAHQGCGVRRAARGHRRAAQRRHAPPRRCRWCCSRPERASLYVDSSGEALFKRGWRDDAVAARASRARRR
jgi:putative N6-adenine-specific DNA methylase